MEEVSCTERCMEECCCASRWASGWLVSYVIWPGLSCKRWGSRHPSRSWTCASDWFVLHFSRAIYRITWGQSLSYLSIENDELVLDRLQQTVAIWAKDLLRHLHKSLLENDKDICNITTCINETEISYHEFSVSDSLVANHTCQKSNDCINNENENPKETCLEISQPENLLENITVSNSVVHKIMGNSD